MARSGSFQHFYVYGGPEGGTIARVNAGATTYSQIDHRRRHVLPYSYVLVGDPSGGQAFVPEDDNELRRAFLSISRKAGDRETEALTAEMKRRGLAQ